MENRYYVLETEGYEVKSEAYEQIRMNYSHMKGVTTYQGEDGLWYIVQSKLLSTL